MTRRRRTLPAKVPGRTLDTRHATAHKALFYNILSRTGQTGGARADDGKVGRKGRKFLAFEDRGLSGSGGKMTVLFATQGDTFP